MWLNECHTLFFSLSLTCLLVVQGEKKRVVLIARSSLRHLVNALEAVVDKGNVNVEKWEVETKML